ncbi:NACHT, LRR and PYD domains-containing protein 12 [Gaertneriomyces sp. JEL0708]|nr:NACHT, LRR and PYD domains-containing protein 12 [Gaertneriomyces sp. JEL0708]
MPPKKKSTSAGKRKEAELEAQAQTKLAQLKQLRQDYAGNCRHFVAEPLPAIVRRIDQEIKRTDGYPENVDKVILNSLSLAPNDVYSITTTFDAYAALSGIYIWRAEVNAKALEALSQFISTHPSVTILHLIDCGITAKNAERLALLARSNTLTTLSLDHNPLGSEGVNLVFAAIRDNPLVALQRLSLRYCDATTQAAESAGATLATNTSIQDLDLTGNFISDYGLVPFATYLRTNSSLQVLRLAANQISNTIAAQVPGQITQKVPSLTPLASFCATIATEATGLSLLDFRGNHMGDPGAECLLEMLKTRKTLALAKQCEPLVVLISERMSEKLFESIWEVNEGMRTLASKKKGKGKKGGKKK